MGDKTLKPWLLAASIAALFTSSPSDAAGLGRLAVMSALGQPLNAEIELLSVQKGEIVIAKLASVDTYQKANLPYNSALVGTRVTVEKRSNGQLYLKATTPRPINEPFVELVVELSSEHGRVTRQYTVLLDPPGYGRGTAEVPPPAAIASTPRPPVVSPQESVVASTPSDAPSALEAPATPSAEAVVGSTPIQGAPTPIHSTPSSSAEATGAADRAAASQYGPIKPGETLFRIARSVKPEGATLEQTLVALYRTNPDAFIKKNMNLVKSGKILKVPEASEFAAVPHREAMQEFHVQVADFNAMRGKLADGAAAAREAGSVTSGRISARVAEASDTQPRDTVRLSKGESPTGKAARSAGTADRVRALEEEAVAREKALADANERIAQLEKTIKDMQRLTELKSSAAPVAQPLRTDKPVAAPAPAAKSGIPTAAIIAAAPGAEGNNKTAAPDTAKAAKPEAMKSVGEASKAASEPPKALADAGVAKPAASQPGAATPTQAVKPKTTTPPPTSNSEDILEAVMNEPLYLAAGGAAVLLGGLGFMVARRRRKSDDDIKEDKSPIKVAPSFAPKSAATAAAVGAGAAVAQARMPAPALAHESHQGHNPGRDFGADVDSPVPDEMDSEAIPDSPYSNDDSESVAQATPDLRVARDDHFQDDPETLAAERGLDRATSASIAHENGETEKTPEVLVQDYGFDDAATMQMEPRVEHQAAVHGEATQGGRDSNLMDFNLDALPAIDSSAETLVGERTTASADSSLEDFKLNDLDLNFGAAPAAAGNVKDDHWYDVQQKFDLAKAYEEMGDKDGAREILQEVVKEGDSEQQTQASKLLGSLS